MTGLHFQAAVPKYLRLEMQPASGNVIPAGALSGVEQTVRITNSMQVGAPRPRLAREVVSGSKPRNSSGSMELTLSVLVCERQASQLARSLISDVPLPPPPAPRVSLRCPSGTKELADEVEAVVRASRVEGAGDGER